MSNLIKLIESLEKIISELNANGKIEAAKFFTVRYDEIIEYGDEVSLEIIETLSTCRAMSQYSNFTQKEEILLDNVVDNAIVVKNKTP